MSEPVLDRPVKVSYGREVLRLGHDVGLRDQRNGVVDRRVDCLRALQIHALRALEEHEVPQRRLAERHERQIDAGRVVMRRGGQAWAAEVRSRANRRQQVLHQREVQHLLGRDAEDDLPPSENRVEFLGRQSLGLVLLEREACEQVLAHDAVLELRRLAQHVDQRLTLLDDKGCLGRC
jgi:hypothetical protein